MKKLKWSVMAFFAIISISNAQVRINSTTATTISSGVTSNNNNAIGATTTLQKITTGIDNNAFGFNSLTNNKEGNYNNALGRNSLYNNITGHGNNGFGHAALFKNTGSYNCAFGFQTLYNNAEGSYNTAMGFQSGFTNFSGSYNIALGTKSLYKNISGSNNIAIGYNTGQEILGSGNTLIGTNILGTSNMNNHVVIGDGAGNQRIFINDLGNMGIGTTTPTAKVEIVGGDLKIPTNRIQIGNNFSNWVLNEDTSLITNKGILIQSNGEGATPGLTLVSNAYLGAAQFGLAGGDNYYSNIAKKSDVILRANTPGSLIITNEGTSGSANDIKFVTQDSEPSSQVRMTID